MQSTTLELASEAEAKAASSFKPCKAAHLAVEADHHPLLALLALDHINGGIHVLQQGGSSGEICNAWVQGPCRGSTIPPTKTFLRAGALAACLVQAAM